MSTISIEDRKTGLMRRGNAVDVKTPFPEAVSCLLRRFAAVFLVSSSLSLLPAEDLVIGITSGFPPYQYLEDQEISGFDADVIRLVSARANLTMRFASDRWDDLLNYLRQGRLDCITGMEITPRRGELFDFTAPYYERTNAIFVRAEDTWIKGVEDLYHQRITGDRQSDIEGQWIAEGIRDRFRIQETTSKEEAMRLLGARRSLAAIMPREVGFYLARQLGIAVRILHVHPSGTPVALAVRKGDQDLLEKLNRALEELIREGEIENLYRQRFPGASDVPELAL